MEVNKFGRKIENERANGRAPGDNKTRKIDFEEWDMENPREMNSGTWRDKLNLWESEEVVRERQAERPRESQTDWVGAKNLSKLV